MQLKNGKFLKGVVCGITVRTGNSRSTGNPYSIVTLVIETDRTADKERIQLDRDALAAGLDKKFNLSLLNKTVLIPFWTSVNKGYVTNHYAGAEEPVVFEAKASAS